MSNQNSRPFFANSGLAPAGLSAEAKRTLKSYGGWTAFMQSYGLKAWKDDDAKEGKSILEALAKNDGDSGTKKK